MGSQQWNAWDQSDAGPMRCFEMSGQSDLLSWWLLRIWKQMQVSEGAQPSPHRPVCPQECKKLNVLSAVSHAVLSSNRLFWEEIKHVYLKLEGTQSTRQVILRYLFIQNHIQIWLEYAYLKHGFRFIFLTLIPHICWQSVSIFILHQVPASWRLLG